MLDLRAKAKNHKVHDHTRGATTYVATQVDQKVIVEVIIHDGMLDLRLNGAGIRHLRRDLWERFGKICR